MEDRDGAGGCFSPTGANRKIEILPQRTRHGALRQQRE